MLQDVYCHLVYLSTKSVRSSPRRRVIWADVAASDAYLSDSPEIWPDPHSGDVVSKIRSIFTGLDEGRAGGIRGGASVCARWLGARASGRPE